jgi:hypothetical protein
MNNVQDQWTLLSLYDNTKQVIFEQSHPPNAFSSEYYLWYHYYFGTGRIPNTVKLTAIPITPTIQIDRL